MADRTIEILVELDAAGAITSAEDVVAAIGGIQAASTEAGTSMVGMDRGITAAIGGIQAASTEAGTSMVGMDRGITAATGAVNDSTERTGTSMLNMGAKIGRVASLGMVAWDRLSIAQNAVENAQIRQTLASERLTEAIAKHGAGSKEAAKAQEELDIATRGVTIAQEREMVRMTVGIAVVIPSMIKGIASLIGMAKALDVANLANVATTDALTSSRLALIATTGVGIIAAIGIGTAIAAGAFSVHTPTTGSTQNFYGDINLPSVQRPSDFAREVTGESQSTINRSTRP